MTFCKNCVKKLDTLATVYYKQSSYFQSLKVYWEAWGHSVKMEKKNQFVHFHCTAREEDIKVKGGF